MKYRIIVEDLLSGWYYVSAGYRIFIYTVILSFVFYYIVALSGVLNKKGKGKDNG